MGKERKDSMNAAIALIPFVLIRVFLFRLLDKNRYNKAQKFAPLEKNKQGYYIIYQFCQLLLFILPFFNRLQLSNGLEYLGIFFYVVGLVIIGQSIYSFAQTKSETFSQNGIYRFSRHPMYVGYFIFYLGIGFLMASYVYLILLTIFQICAHQIILAEEKWCLETFGVSYENYMKKVRRYL